MGKSLNGKELGIGITQRKDGRYVGRFTNRFGKRECVYGDTVAEVRKLLREVQHSNDIRENVCDSTITLDEWYHRFIELFKGHCRNTTLAGYEYDYRVGRDTICRKQMKDISLIDAQEFINNIKANTVRKQCKKFYAEMFEKAVNSNIVSYNPFAHVELKGVSKTPERTILSEAQSKHLVEELGHSSGKVLYDFVVIALNTGMRIGEILSLKWSDIDFDDNIIHIRRTLAIVNTNNKIVFEIHETKTESGMRDIYLPKIVGDTLIQRKDKYGITNEYIFPDKSGEHPINTNTVRNSLALFIRNMNRDDPGLNFPAISPHCFRHTFATNCIEKGMNPKTLQKILGHSSVSITMDLYCHVRSSTVKDEMKLVLCE